MPCINSQLCGVRDISRLGASLTAITTLQMDMCLYSIEDARAFYQLDGHAHNRCQLGVVRFSHAPSELLSGNRVIRVSRPPFRPRAMSNIKPASGVNVARSLNRWSRTGNRSLRMGVLPRREIVEKGPHLWDNLFGQASEKARTLLRHSALPIDSERREHAFERVMRIYIGYQSANESSIRPCQSTTDGKSHTVLTHASCPVPWAWNCPKQRIFHTLVHIASQKQNDT